MTRSRLSAPFFCPLASELGIPRDCMRNQACQRCAFAEWVDDTRPQCASPPALEVSEARAPAA